MALEGRETGNSNISEQKWLCKLCTFLNPATKRYCHACQGWRFEHIFNECVQQSTLEASSSNNSSSLLSSLSAIPSPESSPKFEDTVIISSPSFLPSSPTSNSCTELSPPSLRNINKNNNNNTNPTDTTFSQNISTFTEEELSERCPRPDPGVPLLEFPWDLELLYDRGRTLLMKISVRRNSKKAWELLQQAAKRGHPAAQWDLALRKPDSDEIDWDKAVEFYVMQMQNPPINLDNMNNNNNGLMDNGAVAAFCLGCCFLGGWGVERREDRAVSLYKIAVRRGYLKGLNEVGWIYDHGLGGVVQDSSSAFKCFKLLANRGYALAQYNTGRCFRDGRGVPSSYTEAVNWLVKASEQGYHNAQRSLGNIYQTGADSVIKKDIVKAITLYRDSASNGDPAGIHKIQEMTSNTRVTYKGAGVFKEPVSYFKEIKIKKRNTLTSSRGIEDKTTTPSTAIVSLCNSSEGATVSLLSSSPVSGSAATNIVENKGPDGSAVKKPEELKGEYWVPKLYDQCCLVLSRGPREVYMNANIPVTIQHRIEKETLQCSAGCGTMFYGRGRVTRTFVYYRLVNSSSTGGIDLHVGTWRDFGANVETTAVRRYLAFIHSQTLNM